MVVKKRIIHSQIPAQERGVGGKYNLIGQGFSPQVGDAGGGHPLMEVTDHLVLMCLLELGQKKMKKPDHFPECDTLVKKGISVGCFYMVPFKQIVFDYAQIVKYLIGIK
jgi:hypothetical protein